jgi:hypothetical protein
MNTEELNMTTHDLIKNLRQLMPLGPQIATMVTAAADRLEELQREKVLLAEAVCSGNSIHAEKLVQERDEARAEVEQVKKGFNDALAEISSLLLSPAVSRTVVRPEPSRLEIAAMWISGFAGFNNFNTYTREHVIEQAFINADALIAAAKESKL